MLGSAALGWALFAASVLAAPGTPLHVATSVGAVFALLRAALFIHEIAHHKPGQLPGFEVAWNALVGVPLGVPSLMYVGSHMDHHRGAAFGTDADPEYAPIAHWSRLRIALFVATVAFVPVLLPIRWAVLGPLSYRVPRLRSLVVGKLSTLAINPHYTRPLPRGRNARRWAAEEAACALFFWAVAVALAFSWLPLQALAQWIGVGAGLLVVNQVRTLAAHGYENAGEPMDAEAQLLDSINLTGTSPLTAFMAPVGLRYHALHHYFPSLPYHSLGRVHRALLRDLPQDAPYRHTLRPGLLATLQQLWDRTSREPLSA